MALFGSSVKKHLTPEERSLYYMTLKDLNNILGFNYLGSLMLNSKFKVIEKHNGNIPGDKDFGSCISDLMNKFRKFEYHELPEMDMQLFPFKKLIVSLKDKYILIVTGRKLSFSLFVGKENLNEGSIVNIICPKISNMLDRLESINE